MLLPMQAIDAAAIIQRLEAFALGDADDMTEAQVSAALGLLDRVLPSLVEIELKSSEVAPTATTFVEE